jgi:hypothetical protein
MTAAERMVEHAAYLGAHRGRIADSYLGALCRGSAEPAVLLLDLEDESARAIAEGAVGGATIEAYLAEGRRLGRSSSVTWSMPRAFAVALLAGGFHVIAEQVAIPDEDGCYWVVVVARGSASAILMPPIAEAGPWH